MYHSRLGTVDLRVCVVFFQWLRVFYAGPARVVQPDDELFSGPAADVFACGMVMFCLLNRGYPDPAYQSFASRARYEGLTTGYMLVHPLAAVPGVTASLLQLLEVMLAPDASARATVPQLLQHPWLADADADAP